MTPASAKPAGEFARFTTIGTRFASMNGSRRNPRAHQALMNTWKALALHAIREARCAPVTPPVTILAVVHRTTRATSDAHNVAPTIKAIVDAAVAAGLIPDDNDDVVTEQTTRGRGEILRPVDPLTRRRTARPAITTNGARL